MSTRSTSKFDNLPCIYPSCANSSIPVELFNVHLARCRRRFWTNGPLVVCEFNSTHTFPAPEAAYHRFTCTDRLVSIDKQEKRQQNADRSGRKQSSTDHCQRSEMAGQQQPKERCESARGRSKRGGGPKRWNVGPRLQKAFRKMSVVDEEGDEKPADATGRVQVEPRSSSNWHAFGQSRGRGRGRFPNPPPRGLVIEREGRQLPTEPLPFQQRGRRGYGGGGPGRNYPFMDSVQIFARTSADATPNLVPSTSTSADRSSPPILASGSNRGFRPWSGSRPMPKVEPGWPKFESVN